MLKFKIVMEGSLNQLHNPRVIDFQKPLLKQALEGGMVSPVITLGGSKTIILGVL